MRSIARSLALLPPALLAVIMPATLMASGNVRKVKHVIIVMQENHSFDNYFGALAYAPGSPYHKPSAVSGGSSAGCSQNDHACVDGLDCAIDAGGNFTCSNSNVDDDGSIVRAFHDPHICIIPDLDHGWPGTHHEINFADGNLALLQRLNDGFVRVNDVSEQQDLLGENATEDDTMGFYNQNEIPFYYDLAQKFAISDRYFSSLLGPTFPNRAYLMAATSFGHLSTNEIIPPLGGYKPITGSIFKLMDEHGVTWADYFQDLPQAADFRPFPGVPPDPHFQPLPVFLAQAAGTPGAGILPDVSFVDPNFGYFGLAVENDEHPPTDIRRGQFYVSQVVNALRSGPYWKDSVLFISYDEHGGFYDHAKPPAASQGGELNPDGINPGQCEDLSNPPTSEQPGGGANCYFSMSDAAALCPDFTATGPYPAECANFNQLGVRVPFVAISPFSKPHYVSHTVGDHTSLLAFIETVFMGTDNGVRPHLTARDLNANPLLDLFDFNGSPSLNTPVDQTTPAFLDCTP